MNVGSNADIALESSYLLYSILLSMRVIIDI